MYISESLVRKLERLEPELKDVLISLVEEIETYRETSVTKVEFNELKEIVRDLAEAQNRSEKRIEKLEITVRELAEAQKRTEQRVEELAEAQKRTEEEVRNLAISLKKTQQMVGGLSDTVGYGLEDRAIKALPALLKERYRITVTEHLRRGFIKYSNNEEEVNIYGKGRKGKKEINIIGEAKARLSKKDVNRFLNLIGRLESNKIIGKMRLLFLISYSVIPEVERYAKERGIEVIWSYEI